MHRAAREGDLKEVKDLYNQGVPVESRDGDNYTPLHWAARRGRYEVVEYLISRNCDLNPRENLGRTPALLAAYVGWQTQSDVLWLLIRNGADVKCGDSENWTLLHRASERNWVRLAQHILETVQVDVNVAMANGQTPLMIAARQGCFEVAALLIRSGANVNCIDNRRRTALHYAAKECQILHSKIVDILLAEGCLLNPLDDDGNTPMHTYFYIQQKLLAAGASPNVRNNNNKTGFGFFMDEGNKITVDAIKLFLKQGAFLEDSDYEIISRCDDLKQGILQDGDSCTQLIVNKFNHHSLPEIFANLDFARQLPSPKKLQISGTQNMAHEIANFVESDIQKNTYCNVMEARPLVLTLMCVQSLLNS